MARERTRDGRRETRPTAADRLAAQLSTQRGDPLSGGDVARMPAEARRRLLMRLGFLSGRASVAELRDAVSAGKEPPTAGKPGGHGRGAISDGTRLAASNEAGPRGDRKAIERDEAQPTRLGAPRRAPSGEARSEIVPVRLTPSERTELERRAGVAGWSLSEWIRACLLGEP